MAPARDLRSWQMALWMTALCGVACSVACGQSKPDSQDPGITSPSNDPRCAQRQVDPAHRTCVRDQDCTLLVDDGGCTVLGVSRDHADDYAWIDDCPRLGTCSRRTAGAQETWPCNFYAACWDGQCYAACPGDTGPYSTGAP